MGYAAAIQKAWEDLARLKPAKNILLKFLADEYTVDLAAQKVMSLSCNVAAKDYLTILVLHYLASKLKGLPALTNEWASFKELSAIEGYSAAFRERAIEPILRKYGSNPEGLLSALERLSAKRIQQGDVGVVVEAFEGVPVLITLWRQDEEFGPEANMLFDSSIKRIFCTEDIVVLAGMIAQRI